VETHAVTFFVKGVFTQIYWSLFPPLVRNNASPLVAMPLLVAEATKGILIDYASASMQHVHDV
jgi:hypothetical protein